MRDVYSGALGKPWGIEGDDVDFATAENLSNVLPALKGIFEDQHPERKYVWGLHCLKYFDTPETATEHLFFAGFRA